MNLTFSLLERWLKDYDPISTIYQPDLKCEGVRFYAEGINMDPRFLYISKSEQLFPNSNPREILLVQQNNIICLFADDLEEVYNQVIGAFEYYSDLNYRLMIAAQQDNYEQEIADLCSEIFGPTFLIDQSYHFVGISAIHQKGWTTALWDEFVNNKGATLEHLRMFCDDVLFKNINRKLRNQIVYQPVAAPFFYAIVSTYCDSDGKIMGQCAVSTKHPIENADIELMNWVIAALESNRRVKTVRKGNRFSEIIVQAALAGEILTPKDRDILYSMQNWKENSWLCMGAIALSEESGEVDLPASSMIPYFKEHLPQILPGTVAIVQENLLVFCFSLKEKNVPVYESFVREKLEPLLKLKNCVIGLSLPFQRFENIYYYLWQAQDSLLKSSLESTCSSFVSCALDAILSRSDFMYSLSCIHPAVLMIGEYDSTYHSELTETLWQYLRNNKSYAAVAKQLHIHRNTVLYRLEKIQEMYPLDFQDPELVEYLLISIRIYRKRDTI